MATTTITLSATEKPSGRLFLKGTDVTYRDFRDDLLRDGFAMVKGAVPCERAETYGEQMFQWLEDL